MLLCCKVSVTSLFSQGLVFRLSQREARTLTCSVTGRHKRLARQAHFVDAYTVVLQIGANFEWSRRRSLCMYSKHWDLAAINTVSSVPVAADAVLGPHTGKACFLQLALAVPFQLCSTYSAQISMYCSISRMWVEFVCCALFQHVADQYGSSVAFGLTCTRLLLTGF